MKIKKDYPLKEFFSLYHEDNQAFGDSTIRYVQYDDEEHEIDFAQAYAIMMHSQTNLAQQKEEVAKKMDTPQIHITISKRGENLPNLSIDLAKSQVSVGHPTPSSSILKSSVPNVNAKPQVEIFNASLASYFQAIDIIDHAKKTKI